MVASIIGVYEVRITSSYSIIFDEILFGVSVKSLIFYERYSVYILELIVTIPSCLCYVNCFSYSCCCSNCPVSCVFNTFSSVYDCFCVYNCYCWTNQRQSTVSLDNVGLNRIPLMSTLFCIFCTCWIFPCWFFLSNVFAPIGIKSKVGWIISRYSCLNWSLESLFQISKSVLYVSSL